jgi:hypothetical protein
MEPEHLACSHWPDVHEAINLAAVTRDGRARVGPVRARREPDSRPWTLGAIVGDGEPAPPEFGLYRADALVARLHARDAESARNILREHGLGREGDRVRHMKPASAPASAPPAAVALAPSAEPRYQLTSRMHALRHPCAYCGAIAGQPCARSNGEHTRIACHAERHSTAITAGAPVLRVIDARPAARHRH